MVRIQTYSYSAILNPHAPNDCEGLEICDPRVLDLSIAALLRIVAGLLFFAGIFPAYYSLSRPYHAKMDGRSIVGAILGVMATVIQRLALHFFNHFPFLNQEGLCFF